MKRYLGAAVLVAAAACGQKQAKLPPVQTATVTRRDIIVDAQANGVVEPIVITEVKSKASGIITKFPVQTGSHLRPGDLIVQVDTRDVQNQYDQAKASLDAAQAKLQVAQAAARRSDTLFKARVITAQEHEQSALDLENARAGVVAGQTNLDLAKQRLEDATITAPAEGTVIEADVALGTVITSATGSFGGGTTLVKMADLSEVRIRSYFAESDIGNIHPGQAATVTVDAFPDRRFQGTVDKIEPQSVTQQNVTMFPVLVNLDNREGLLRPGMNGETSVLIDEHDNVLAIPNDAIKTTREAGAIAAMLGMNSDSVNADVRAQMGTRGGGFGGGGGRNGGGRRGGGNTASSGGEVSLSTAAQQGGQDQAQGGGRRGPRMDVSDADCTKLDATLAKHPKEKKQLDDLRAKMMAARGQGGGGGRGQPNPDRDAMNAIYKTLNIDPMMVGACRFKAGGNANGGGASGRGGGNSANAFGSRSAQGGTGRLQPSGENPVRPRTRAGLVFVADSNHYQPRVIQIGQGNFDYTEVVSGLKEGEKVVMLASLALQAQRQAQNARAAANASPLGGQQGPGGGRGPGGGGPPGGGGRGGP